MSTATLSAPTTRNDYSRIKVIEQIPASERTPEQQRYYSLLVRDYDVTDQDAFTAADIEFLRASSLWNKSFFQLSEHEVTFGVWLCLCGPTPLQVSFELWKLEDIIREGQFYVIPPEDNSPYLAKIGDAKWASRNNDSNRSFQASNSKHLFRLALAGLWAPNGETVIFDDNRRQASSQHRLIAWLEALTLRPSLKFIPVTVVRNVPAFLVGSIETGRKRTSKDEVARFHELIPSDLLVTREGHKYGPKESDVRGKIVKVLDSGLRKVWLRYRGMDVHASTTSANSKWSPAIAFELLDRSHDRIGGLSWLACQCFATLSGASDDVSFYSPEDYFAALVLYSNREAPPVEYSISGEGARRTRVFEYPESVLVDEEFCSAFLDSLKKGWIAENFRYADTSLKGQLKAGQRHHKFASLVGAVRWFAANRTIESVPAPIDPTTGEVVGQPSQQWTCPPLSKHTFPLNPADGKDWTWPHFGGMDCGKLEKLGKDDE